MNQRYLSIDLETTGLDSATCQVIEFGCVIDDFVTPLDMLPAFHSYVTHPVIVGEPYALAMNAEILWKLAEPHKYPGLRFTTFDQLLPQFHDWLIRQDMIFTQDHKLPVGGKNFPSFDLQFIKRLPGFSLLAFKHRFFDPAMMYWEPEIDGADLPDTKTCMRRAGIDGEVSHNAIADALVVAQLVRVARDRKIHPGEPGIDLPVGG